uniref:Uncharacterized protein n=1 Tax=Anguilla anguilla TaxID=7936 RepID=A0A0E9P572_ANGAN
MNSKKYGQLKPRLNAKIPESVLGYWPIRVHKVKSGFSMPPSLCYFFVLFKYFFSRFHLGMSDNT